jgi:ppGpp synthetase/RelA/SpoT-type nucleotidyltranferase
MPFITPQYSRKQVNAAGDVLIRYSESDIFNSEYVPEKYSEISAYFRALDVINNWRSAHSGPLLSMRMLLTRQAKSVDRNALIAQRIKRLSSIELKLRRFRTMKLSQMQDIGGCRAIVGSVSQVTSLADNFQKSRTKNIFDHVDNYIERHKVQGTGGYT